MPDNIKTTSQQTGRWPSRRNTWAIPIALGIAGMATAYIPTRRLSAGRASSGDLVTYPPLDTPKPIADNLWIVDSGPVRPLGMALPVRMAVIRLRSGDLLLCSPTRFSKELARDLGRYGPVRHLVAPTFAHWMFLADWQKAFPEATTWAAPGLRDRRQVRRSGVRLDADLGGKAPASWSGEIALGVVPGAAGFHEAFLFHQPTRTLILADLLQNLAPCRLPSGARLIASLTGNTKGTTPAYLQLLLKLQRQQARAAVRRMLAFQPERVIFAHGDWFGENGTERLRQGFKWLL